MSTLRRHFVPVALVVALVGAGAALAVLAGVPGPEREITLVARDMAFYLPGDPTPNPTLVVGAGERLRITLQNDEPGLPHDLAARGLGLAIAPLSRQVLTASVVVTAPREAREHEYVCTLHPQMMRGVVRVVR